MVEGQILMRSKRKKRAHLLDLPALIEHEEKSKRVLHKIVMTKRKGDAPSQYHHIKLRPIITETRNPDGTITTRAIRGTTE